ncbi:MAG: rhomboid family intramembrane serine protease [Pseudomonadota bacterium]|nr:rhomboid family intramembrane serine protease [Pseudomonadota bacterium]
MPGPVESELRSLTWHEARILVKAMRINIPDPAFSHSERASANFRLALKISLIFVALLWIVSLLNWGLALDLTRFGVRPGVPAGLAGIFFAPLLHGNLAHLLSNSVPVVVLGTGMLYLYPNSALKVIPAIYLVPGLVVWQFGRASLHIGASGLVYGLATYILVAGLIRRDRRAISAAMLVFFLYGTLVWGVLPSETGVSWETHLVAGLVGVVLAILFRRLDVPPRKRYTWEEEDSDDSENSVD